MKIDLLDYIWFMWDHESYVWAPNRWERKRGKYGSFVYGDDKEIKRWIDASETNWTAWQGLQDLLDAFWTDKHPIHIELMLRGKDNIPPALLEWAKDVARGKRKAPKRKRGPDGFENILCDRFIVIYVAGLVNCGGFPATKSIGELCPDEEAYEDEDKSACHMVADSMGMKYKAVCKIWQHPKWKEFKEAIGLYFQTGDEKHYNRAMGLNLFKNDRRPV